MPTRPLPQFLLAHPRLATSYDGQPAYLVVWQSAPSARDASSLAELLTADYVNWPVTGALVVARQGQLSPWSSTVRNILANCGFTNAHTVLHGRYHATSTPTYDPQLERILIDDEITRWEHTEEFLLDINTWIHEVKAGLDQHEREAYTQRLHLLNRAPTVAETLLLIQYGSEHCRHLTFTANWHGTAGKRSALLDTLRTTHKHHSAGTLVAYTDNASVIACGQRRDFGPNGTNGAWSHLTEGEPVHTVIKTETHNHPTGVAPWPGAATGVGGEIRDEAATGTGAASHAGLAGYMVSSPLDWSATATNDWPPQRATPAQVLRQAPLGATAFANEFGRPTLAGFCRIFAKQDNGQDLGFHKPVMFAAGMGEILTHDVYRHAPCIGDLVIIFGGPTMPIGLGGGSASSSINTGLHDKLSVQRGHAEMQRRTQEVLERCRLATHNPLRRLHDLGAGGLGVALAELSATHGCKIDLDRVPVAQAGMDAATLLCNEAQERYLLVIAPDELPLLQAHCDAEQCTLAVLGKITDTERLVATHAGERCLDLPLACLYNLPATTTRDYALPVTATSVLTIPANTDLNASCHAVLRHPNVADKSCLVTIADRGVGGLTARDQFIGPWQVAVADCAITHLGYTTHHGRAMACGERPALAACNPAAGARIAIAEALTNLAAGGEAPLATVKLALTWIGNRATARDAGELIAAVHGVCEPFLHELGLGVQAGKDSLAMRTHWQDKHGNKRVVSAPTTCIATVFTHIDDTHTALTPQLSGRTDTILLWLTTTADLPLGGSTYADTLAFTDGKIPDIEAQTLRAWWQTMTTIHAQGLALAYHDVSDGGVFTTICEMCFASGQGATLVLDALCQPAMGMDIEGYEQSADTVAPLGLGRVAAVLFTEQPGALIEVARADAPAVLRIAADCQLPVGPQTLGWPTRKRRMQVTRNAQAVVDISINQLRTSWSQFGLALRAKRDQADTSAEEHAAAIDPAPGLHATPQVPTTTSPRNQRRPVATVLRAVGTNGHVEMAAALDHAGFATRIITVTELVDGTHVLTDGLLALPGGFSHGDVLGAGVGMAATLTHNDTARAQLTAFFARPTLTLGVCNGCQVLVRLGDLLPQAHIMPSFATNRSDRFECRLSLVEILPTASPLLAPLAGLRLPVPLACGEGRTQLPTATGTQLQAALRFINVDGLAATTHPANPTGAVDGLCGFCTPDGQVTLLLPHPERAIRPQQLSWCPPAWRARTGTPWLAAFCHARDHLVTMR